MARPTEDEEWLRRALVVFRGNKAAIAKFVRISPSAVGQWFKKRRMPRDPLLRKRVIDEVKKREAALHLTRDEDAVEAARELPRIVDDPPAIFSAPLPFDAQTLMRFAKAHTQMYRLFWKTMGTGKVWHLLELLLDTHVEWTPEDERRAASSQGNAGK